MFRVLCVFFLLSLSLHANDDIIQNISSSNRQGGISSIVNGSVSAISGNYIESSMDFALQPHADLGFTRSYMSNDWRRATSPTKYGSLTWTGWNTTFTNYIINFFDKIENRDSFLGYYVEGGGDNLFFQGGKKAKVLTFDPKYKRNVGFTNIASGVLSGQTHPKNIYFDCPMKFRKRRFIRKGNGEERIYKYKIGLDGPRYVYDIKEIRKPNGHRLIFEYGKNGKSITVTSDDKKTVFGSIKFAYTKNSEKKVILSDGRCASYLSFGHETKKDQFKNYYISEVQNPYGVNVNYTYQKFAKKEGKALLKRKTYPNGFFVENDYYFKGKHKTLTGVIDISEKDARFCRVREQKSPVGTTLEPITTHRYIYYGGGAKCPGHTDVYDVYNRRTRYQYTGNEILYKVEKYLSNGKRYRVDKCWYDSAGTLLAEQVVDENNRIVSGHFFRYDPYGNVTTEIVCGNIKGSPYHIPFQESNVNDTKKMDQLVTKYTYTKDNFNLVETEIIGDISNHYTYKSRTNLMTRKLVKVKGEILQREFNEYDRNASLILKIIDDGSSEEMNDRTNVSIRRLERITPVEDGNGIGLPQIIDDLYEENGQEVLLKRSVISYSKQGQEIEKQVFDGNGQHQYTICTQYDLRGNPIQWNDAEGNIYYKTYDNMNRLIWEKNSLEAISYQYDHAGRMIAKQSTADFCSEKYSYDLAGNLIKKIDQYGNETLFEYDDMNRPIKTVHVSTGIVEETGYDVFNNPIKKIDGNGNTTEFGYTINKKPYLIKYCDGTKEEFKYNIHGDLVEKIAVNGMTTRFEVDSFHRVTRETAYSMEGDLLTEKSWTYNAFNKLSETDEEGNTTYYRYDGGGRLIEEKKGDFATQYYYHSNGEVYEKRIYSSPDQFYSEFYEYNLLGKIIEEKVITDNGELQRLKQMKYDPMGNIIEKIEWINEAESITKFSYDGHSRLIESIDPEGNVTTIQYTKDNEIIETNAKGIQTIKKLDAVGNVIKITTLNSLGQEIKKVEKKYDLATNLVEEIHSVIANSKVIKTIINRWELDSQNRIITICEAAGTQEQKITRFEYNEYGEKICKVNPDGSTILYTYTPQGYLESLQTPDLNYRYQYDRVGNPILIEDLIQGNQTVRIYNEYNQLIEEKLGNDLTVTYKKDSLGRNTSIQCPGKDKVCYEYEGVNLSKVYFGNDFHSYSYDQSGYITTAVTANQIEISTNRDKIGRITDHLSTVAAYEEITYDNNHNVTGCTFNGKRDTYTHDDLDQLITENETKFSYDSLSNRLSKNDEKFSYNHLNQLDHLDYDLNGNPIEIDGYQLSYDTLGRLTNLKSDNEEISYTYDSFDRRLSRTVNGITEYFLYQNEEEIGSYINGVAKEFRVLGKGRGAEIGSTIFFELEDQRYFPIHDYQGSIVALTTHENQLDTPIRYTAFGERIGNIKSPWCFMGKREEPQTRWINFGKRFYLPKQGRFLTPDPVGFKDGPNLYTYCHNRPLHFVDLRGETATHYVETPGILSGGKQAHYVKGRPSGHPIGKHLGGLLHHLLPRNNVSWRVAAFNEKFQGTAYQYLPESFGESCVKTVGKRLPGQKDAHVLTNGILSNLSDMMAYAKWMSDQLGGAEVHVNYVATRGFTSDILGVLNQRIGFRVDGVNQTRELVTNLSKVNETVQCYNHSKGADTFYRATKGLAREEKNKLHVHNFGGAKIMAKGDYGHVMNYISKHDPVPFIASPFNYICAWLTTTFTNREINVKFLEPCRTFDHFLSDPTYKNQVEEICVNNRGGMDI